MCQHSKKGGKRCPSHMKGTNAACLLTERTTGAPKHEVKSAFRDLRKEGEDLPAPPPEVVKAFADMQKFSANFDPELNDHDRKIISNSWERTSSAVLDGEVPDGATFHAWRNLRDEVVRRMAIHKSRLMAIGISGALSIGMTACSAVGGADPTPPPTSPSVSAPVTPGPTADPTPSPSATYDAYGIGATGELVSDKHGTWNQAELSDDAPALTFSKDKYRDDVWDKYSEEEVAAAQADLARFIVTHYVDGVSAFDTSPKVQQNQWNNTKGFIHSSAAEDGEKAATSDTPGGGVNLAANIVIQEDRGYSPAPYEAGQARFTTDKIDLNKGYITKKGDYLGFEFQADYTHALVKDGESFTMKTTTTYQAAMRQEDGVFKLSGWNIKGRLEIFDAAGTLIDSVGE